MIVPAVSETMGYLEALGHLAVPLAGYWKSRMLCRNVVLVANTNCSYDYDVLYMRPMERMLQQHGSGPSVISDFRVQDIRFSGPGPGRSGFGQILDLLDCQV